ncbi:Rhs family protein [Pantoea ananatis]|nr:HNH endonuclease [Pantoea ananatis]AWQ19648.1 Rhs family protein [Pantoea ananatis]
MERFTSSDPPELEVGWNLYQYAPNPLSWVDPLGLASRPDNGLYHIFNDHQVNPANRYSSDSVQFRQANKDLISRMDIDPEFRKDLIQRYHGLTEWSKTGNMSNSPPGLTWHHHEEVNRLTLVDRNDHAINHGLYHPTGKGGRDIWGSGKGGRKGKLNGLTGEKTCN